MSLDRWFELGERYWALGLVAAARSAFVASVEAKGPQAVSSARRLLALAAARHDVALAKWAAQTGDTLVVAGAQLLDKQYSGARRSYQQIVDGRNSSAHERCQAYLGLANVAGACSDPDGERALYHEAWRGIVAAAEQNLSLAEIDLDELASWAASVGAAEYWLAALGTVAASPGVALLRTALLAATGGGLAELEAAAVQSGDQAGMLRVRLAQLQAGPAAERSGVMTQVQALLASHGPSLTPTLRARGYAALANVSSGEAKEALLRSALACRPTDAQLATSLTTHLIEHGKQDQALIELERTLRIDGDQTTTWRQAARIVDATDDQSNAVSRLLDAVTPGAALVARAAPRMLLATSEHARSEVLAGVAAHGHRVKNVLGILGARARSARKALAASDESAQAKLSELETDLAKLYQEWAEYLRAMQKPVPVIERVLLPALLADIVANASARFPAVAIQLQVEPQLPGLNADRTMLQEAVLNVVANAAEACTQNGGGVTVTARVEAAVGNAPILAIEVRDTGPGIPRALVARLFAPGFTTKDNGSGIGLAIAERVIAAHRGRITLQTAEGVGTTLHIELPIDGVGAATNQASDQAADTAELVGSARNEGA